DCDQRVRDIMKCSGNRLLVVHPNLLFGLFRKLKLSAELAAFKDGLRQRTNPVNQLAIGVEDLWEVTSTHSTGCADRKLREELRASHSNVCVGLHQLFFSFKDVRPSLQQSGWQTHGQVLGSWRQRVWVRVGNGSGILTQQEPQRVFLLLYLLLKLRNLRRRRVLVFFGLAQIR